jgi:hypothetical protein
MKAKTKEEFEQVWLEEIHQLYLLTNSLDAENTRKLVVVIHTLEDILNTHTFTGEKTQ